MNSARRQVYRWGATAFVSTRTPGRTLDFERTRKANFVK